MCKYKLFFGIIGLLSLSAAAKSTNPHPYSAVYQQCIEASTNELGNLLCINDEHEKWDTRLNSAWQKTLKNRQNAPAWRQAQRTWIKFRDQQCDIYNFAGNGSGDKTSGELCLLNMTIERTLQLESTTWPAN